MADGGNGRGNERVREDADFLQMHGIKGAGLDDAYGNIHSQILAVESLPSVNKAFAMGQLVQDPLQVNFAHTTDDFAGATSHMCARLNVLSHPRSPSHKTVVHLLDGSSQPVESLGDATLHDHLTLTNVLYVLRFTYNLLSVQKLCQHSHVSFIFLSSHCLVKDLKSSKIIGVGRQLGSLYIIDKASFDSSFVQHYVVNMSPTHSCSLSVTEIATLWHKQLGQPSIPSTRPQRTITKPAWLQDYNETWDLTTLPEGKKPLALVGYIKLSFFQMERLIILRHDSSLRATRKLKASDNGIRNSLPNLRLMVSDNRSMTINFSFVELDLGFARYFLGLELVCSSHGTFVTQGKYLHDILDDCKMQDARSVSTPLLPGIRFDNAIGPCFLRLTDIDE
ncbi:UNVERIFIED_CONTAM: hypothetical protein Sradi_0491500 [Sesamum radiatum]|uniref:Retrovirus-related Pol polyprotein from transposon TNT 1-94-like beta-barrel domain-containing protein n=1 Tax=Sesamum radiatum TaxID=300843 RepID=A0AAW2WAS6_SESRA